MVRCTPVFNSKLWGDIFRIRSLLTKAEEDNWALKLEWEEVTEELLYDSIQKILNQNRYK